jgi:RNA polymerase sigma-70 factor (ECF subfamily)
VDLYEPVLIRVAKSRGLQTADAQELAQEVLITVLNSIASFRISPQVGSFRRWMATIMQNKILDHVRCLQRIGNRAIPMDLVDVADAAADEIDTLLETQWRYQMFAKAVDAVRDTVQVETWTAFWRSSIDLVPIEQVALELKTSIGSVYVARSRVISKLRRWVLENSSDLAGS